KHVLRPLDVDLARLHHHLLQEVVVLYVLHSNTYELCLGGGYRASHIGEVYASGLYRPVDVPSPGIAVVEYVYWQTLIGELPYQSARTAGSLSLRRYQYYVLLLPESVLVEPLPDRILLN